MAPQPHLLAGSGTTSLTATATSSNTNSNRGTTGGGFPELESSLLQVRTTYFMAIGVWFI